MPLQPHGEALFALKGEFAPGAGGGMQNSLYVRMKETIGRDERFFTDVLSDILCEIPLK